VLQTEHNLYGRSTFEGPLADLCRARLPRPCDPASIGDGGLKGPDGPVTSGGIPLSAKVRRFVSRLSVRKLHFGAGNYFGPASGLGGLEHGPVGELRPVLGQRLRLPLSLPASFLWELQLTAIAQPMTLRLQLLGDTSEPPTEVRLMPARRGEAVGIALPQGAGPVRRLDFLIIDRVNPGQVGFLGLSVLPLAGQIAPLAMLS
jgi:hypothetical protein